jgi:hypothetical protein
MQFRPHRTAKNFLTLCGLLAGLVMLPASGLAQATDPLPSWNESPAKQAIIKFVRSPSLVPPLDRIATFDQDGTLWVEHPMYSQVVYCLDRVPALVKRERQPV